MDKPISKLYKLKAEQVVQNTLNVCKSLNTIKILLLTLNLSCQILVYYKK